MKKSIITLLASLALFMSFGSYTSFNTNVNAAQMVWVSTGKGKKYHLKNPQKHFGKGKTQWKQVTIQEAKQKGYTPSNN